jgi:hypothetical protein
MKNIHCMRQVLTVLIFLLFRISFLQGQTAWPKDPVMTNAKVTSTGELVITPSSTSSADDFNYLAGKWTMDNRRLNTRLNHCTEWTSFVSTDENTGTILNGVGNTDLYKATLDGQPFEGLTIRLFNPKTRLWSIYWASNTGVMDPPVVGSFEGNIGRFFCKDVYHGIPVLVVFAWDKTDIDNPVWSQAFSTDNGRTWEWNFTNTLHRIK